MQATTAALSNAMTRVDVAEVVVDAVAGALDADAATFAIVLQERGLLRTLASRGLDEGVDENLETELATELPGPNALRRRVPDFFPSHDELREAFPEIADELAHHQAFFFVPLVVGGHSNGLLTLSWAEPRTLSADERRFALLVAGNAAHALDRAGTFEAEQTIAARYGIQSIPTVAVFRDGTPVTGFVGAYPAAAIGRFLDETIDAHGQEAQAASA